MRPSGPQMRRSEIPSLLVKVSQPDEAALPLQSTLCSILLPLFGFKRAPFQQCRMEALQMISPFLQLHIFLAVAFRDPVFALSWPSGLRKPATVPLITCRVNPEPFMPFYHDRDPHGRKPVTAMGAVCPVLSPAAAPVYLPLLPSYPSERILTSTNL